MLLSDAGCSKYQLKSSTGHGAFAQVYLAEALSKSGDSRRVVLKVRLPLWTFIVNVGNKKDVHRSATLSKVLNVLTGYHISASTA